MSWPRSNPAEATSMVLLHCMQLLQRMLGRLPKSTGSLAIYRTTKEILTSP